MTIRGILFDKDGTLLDYAATWMPANRAAALATARGDTGLCERLLRAGGYDPDTGRIAGNAVLAAGNNIEIAAAWGTQVPGWDHAELVELIDGIFQAQGRVNAVPVTELAPTLARLKARGLALGIATSDSEAGIEATLGRFGVLGHFDFLAGYDSGHGVKPEPGMVRAFCDRADLSAKEIAVVGDNLHDLDMGRAAGVGLLVGVLTGTGERSDLEVLADHVLDSITDLITLLESL
jgi:phosphoglycolate phosphatase